MTKVAARGRMLVVDASSLYAVLVGSPGSERIRYRLDSDSEHAAPHVIDVEVFGVIRREFLRGELDKTAASIAVEGLRDWPGERYPHVDLLDRAWELRSTVRGWDAMYVALAEALGAPLVTADRRLANAAGLRCHVEAL